MHVIKLKTKRQYAEEFLVKTLKLKNIIFRWDQSLLDSSLDLNFWFNDLDLLFLVYFALWLHYIFRSAFFVGLTPQKKMPVDQITYSEKYFDDLYEYRYTTIPL